MITHISVDGFKSLKDFCLDLKSGLNVLVGPNGAGKTNIISFFEFISFLPAFNLADAFSAIGGAGTVFSRTSNHTYVNKLIFCINGISKIEPNRYIYYEYSAEIKLGDITKTAYYSEQRLKAQYCTEPNVSPNANMDIDIETRVNEGPDNNESPETTIHSLRENSAVRRSSRFETHEEFRSYIEKFTNDFDSISKSLIGCANILGEDLLFILIDIISSNYYNILPSKVRGTEDVASNPRINKDGSGLSATLWAIKNSKSPENERNSKNFPLRRLLFNLPIVSLDKIVEYVQLANPAIKKIDVSSSPFDNKLQVQISLSDESKSDCNLPLSAMSDGTLKWITFITLLLSKRSIFAVEEPENYLHPNMQAELIRLMRTFSEKTGQILITTHSETVLNNLLPEEVISVSFENDHTKATWLDSSAELNKEIQRTGFGLGYYYMSGALS